MTIARVINQLQSQIFNNEQAHGSLTKSPQSSSNRALIELPACQHKLCKNCWRIYLEMKIKTGDMKISCPSQNCNNVVPIDIIETLIPPEFTRKYLYFDLKSFVENNNVLDWCPAPGCDLAMKMSVDYSSAYGRNSAGRKSSNARRAKRGSTTAPRWNSTPANKRCFRVPPALTATSTASHARVCPMILLPARICRSGRPSPRNTWIWWAGMIHAKQAARAI